MSLSINKNGIIYSSKDTINPNLLAESNIILMQTTDGESYMYYSIPDTSMIVANTTLTVSVDVEMYNVKALSRCGVEPSFYYPDGQYYVGSWISDISNKKIRIYSTSWFGASGVTGIGQRGIYIQGAQFYQGGYIKLSNPKLEIGNVPTAWCPNIHDDFYVGNTQGFIETNEDLPRFFTGHIECKEIVEI